jgi:hypothetical protein
MVVCLALVLVALELIVSVADTYRAMSEDIKRAATEVDDEEVRRAYLALGEIWQKRADAFPVLAAPFPRHRWGNHTGPLSLLPDTTTSRFRA